MNYFYQSEKQLQKEQKLLLKIVRYLVEEKLITWEEEGRMEKQIRGGVE